MQFAKLDSLSTRWCIDVTGVGYWIKRELSFSIIKSSRINWQVQGRCAWLTSPLSLLVGPELWSSFTSSLFLPATDFSVIFSQSCKQSQPASDVEYWSKCVERREWQNLCQISFLTLDLSGKMTPRMETTKIILSTNTCLLWLPNTLWQMLRTINNDQITLGRPEILLRYDPSSHPSSSLDPE